MDKLYMTSIRKIMIMALLKSSRDKESKSDDMIVKCTYIQYTSGAIGRDKNKIGMCIQLLHFQMHHKIVENQDISIITTTSSIQETARPKDHFQAIQHKLDRYTQIRSQNKQAEQQEKISQKLTQIQIKLVEESHAIEKRVECWREMLIQMRVQAQQQTKRCNTLLKQRKEEIRQLKEAIKLMNQQQIEQQTKCEHLIEQKFNKNFKNLTQSLQRQSTQCMNQINSAEQKFQHELPHLDQHIQTSNNYIQSVSTRIHKQVIQQSQSLQSLIHRQQTYQSNNEKQMMELISSTIDQVKHDMDSQRKQRRAMKEKLQFLISTALTRMHLQSPH